MSHDSGSPLSCQTVALSNSPAKEKNESATNQSSLAYPDGFAKNAVLDWFSFTLHVLPPEERQQLQKERLLLNEDEEAFSISPQGRKPAKERRFVQPGRMLLVLRDSVIEWLRGGEILPGGCGFYPSSASVLGTGRVCWHEGRPEMGVHVSLPSSALQRFAVISGVSLIDFLREVASRGAEPTRLDIALDTDAVRMAAVLVAHRSGLTVTKSQKWEIIENESGGLTLYVGSRSGRRMMRFYDKAAEQGVDGVWTRCEVEFKQEHAKTAFEHILSGGDARELILSSIDFRELDNSEVKRRSRCEWWQAWVEVAETVSFPVRKAAAAVADMMAWVLKQTTPTLHLLCNYMGGFRWLENAIEEAGSRVPGWKFDLLPYAMDTLWARAGGAA